MKTRAELVEEAKVLVRKILIDTWHQNNSDEEILRVANAIVDTLPKESVSSNA